MDPCLEKVTMHSQTHGLEKKEKIVPRFLEKKPRKQKKTTKPQTHPNLTGTDASPSSWSILFIRSNCFKK